MVVSDVAAGNPIQQGPIIPQQNVHVIRLAGRQHVYPQRSSQAACRATIPRSGFPGKVGQIVDFGQPAAIKRRPSVALYRNQFHRSKLEQRFRLRRRPGGPKAWKERAMTLLRWALLFFLISIVAGVLGFTGISAATADIARFLFYVFVVIFLVLLILGLTIFRV
jgi:uncharacterized membrane protein YtjA (UPF0391 family)